MAFPEDPLGVVVELKTGGVWGDIPVYTREAITLTGGRGDEAAQADASSATLTINNKDGKYSPNNPLSPLYGLIGRNTPVRVSVQAGPSHLDLDGSTGGYASTPDAADLDITGDLDVRAEISTHWHPEDLTVGRVLAAKWQAETDQRSWMLRLRDTTGQLQFAWSPDGTAAGTWSVVANLPPFPRRVAVRATLDADTGAGGATASLWWAPTLDGPWRLLVAYQHPTTTAIYSSTAPLTIGGTDATSTPPRVPFTGSVHCAEVRAGIGSTLVAAPDFRTLTPGTTAFTDAAGRAWTLHGTAGVTNRNTLFEGEISSWPPRWAPSGADAWTSVQAAGILRRLGQGAKPLPSTLRRRIPSGAPLAYWPMEEGAGATQAYSVVPGVPPLKTVGLEYGADDGLFGSSALPTLGAAASLRGHVRGARTGGWHVEFAYKLEKLPTTRRTFVRVDLSGSAAGSFHILIDEGAARIELRDQDDALIQQATYTSETALRAFTAGWNRMQLFTSPLPTGGFTFTAAWRDVITDTWAYVWTASAASVKSGAIRAVVGSWGSDFQGMGIGHLAVWDTGGTSPTAPGISIYAGADDGFLGERAVPRMLRVADEVGLPLAIQGETAGTERLGPQRPQTLLDLLGECAEADGGILGEQRGAAGLIYRPRHTLYNQPAALELDYAAQDVAPPIEPVDDDQRVRNDITVTRSGGSSARVILTEGPLSVQDPPAGIGVYDEALTLNLAHDEQPPQQAGWRLHLGTWGGLRVPVITLRLHRAPHLIPAYLALRPGDRIVVRNPPLWAGPDDLNLIFEGWSQTVLPRTWEATLTCSPAGPWKVGVWGSARYGTAGTALTAPIPADATTVPVVTTRGPRWTTDGAHLPFDVLVGGERMTVTAVTGATPAQTFTVIRAVNGISKPHAAGAAVTLLDPAVRAL